MKRLSIIIAIVLTSAIFSAVFAQTKTQPVVINFQAVVGDRAFDCRETYAGIGTTGSKMTVSDFRFYVHDVRLTDAKGRETPVALTNDGKFQTEKVALLDFENGEGNCASGTKELNTTLRGTAPKGRYTGVKFRIGVPEELNHLDPTLQPSPLNLSKMLWSWQMGYKFARIDTKTSGRPNGYVLHLGSTKCETDAATQKTVCRVENRPEFAFAKFDPAQDSVKVDLKALFAGANVDVNQENTAAGCMSFEGDGDCGPIFKNLGLSFEGAAAPKQTFMRAGKASKTEGTKTE
ncbi:MAG: metallo-mystery pair system four-Cys motif protein [Acidobacteria bacterium]|nr:metallo-mystery pair system four-Cys motif protein [Acidobacteriota bacterium]